MQLNAFHFIELKNVNLNLELVQFVNYLKNKRQWK